MQFRKAPKQLIKLTGSSTGVLALVLIFALLGSTTIRHSSAAAGSADSPQAIQTVFTNATAITIPSSGNASLYPSPITVSGITGTIPATPGSVKVTLNSFSHTFPDDVGMVLVGPTGAALNIMDGATSADGGQPASGVTITLSDTGSTRVPDEGALVTGTTYLPGDYYNDTYPAPGPGLAYNSPPDVGSSTFSSTFAGTDPNGVWKLYITDFVPGDSGSISGGWSLEITPAVAPPTSHPVLDFDADGKTDYSVVRDVSGSLNWFIQRSTTGFTGVVFGITGDVPVPGDYDGDGKWDVAVWRPGTSAAFYILRSSDGVVQSLAFGTTGDDPRVSQDFDGDGKADPAVTRNVGGSLSWFIQRSTGGFTGVSFGAAASDSGIRGDFDGDGKADVAVYRNNSGSPANAAFILRSSDSTVQSLFFGTSVLDYVVAGDFDGDGKSDIAVWRGKAGGDGGWYWRRSSDGVVTGLFFGTVTIDRPAPGDYDGDAKTDQAVWRAGSPSAFFVNRSTSGFAAFNFGQTGDTVPADTLQSR